MTPSESTAKTIGVLTSGGDCAGLNASSASTKAPTG